jgi:hypothetical protein
VQIEQNTESREYLEGEIAKQQTQRPSKPLVEVESIGFRPQPDSPFGTAHDEDSGNDRQESEEEPSSPSHVQNIYASSNPGSPQQISTPTKFRTSEKFRTLTSTPIRLSMTLLTSSKEDTIQV